MRIIIAIICLVNIMTKSFGQELVVQHEGDLLYIYHVVAPKENWYSLSRMYSTSPKELVSTNQTGLDMGLAITQKIKIPLNSNNFIQTEKIATKDGLIPAYHLISEKEGLFRISQLYKKVPIDRIKEWNKLTSDDVKVGNLIVIGFLKFKKDTLTSNISKLTVLPKADSITTKKAVTVQSNPIVQPQQTVNNPTKPVINTEKELVTNVKAIVTSEKPITKVEKTIPKAVEPTNSKIVFGSEGAFIGLYNSQTKGKVLNNLNGTADIFKSNSGWNDGKYYVLMNTLAPGTIVKVVALSSNLTIYAKVLGNIPPGKENEGVSLRISNAASAQLKVGEGRFEVKISW